MEKRGKVDTRERPLKIALVVDKFYPEAGAAAVQYYELGRFLARLGHDVFVLTTIPRYIENSSYNPVSVKNERWYKEEIFENMHLFRIKVPEIDKSNLIRRAFEHFYLEFRMKRIVDILVGSKRKPDVLLIYSPPLPLSRVGIYSQKKYGIPYVLNVQDLFPKEAIQMGILKNRLVIRYFENMEKKAYKNASAIVVHSERNAEHIKQVKPDKETFVIENWVDENRITPGPRVNKFSIEHGLIDKFVVSFAGTIGFAQDVKSIIESAALLREYKDIVFIIVGDGARKKEAENLIEKYRLNNVRLLPPVPPDEYPLVLHSSDVSLATLIKDLRTPVVPSKIVSIMSAGIPVIASLDLNSDAHQLIRIAKCGFSYPPEKPELIKEAILTLYKNPDLRVKLGKNGRKYVVENLSVRVAAKKFLEIFKSSLNEEG
ncbi:hypothetical protein TRQ7_01555 [Thermotoga sp. RQ7]|jgi:glycosyltransferase involved in cell wall biosynthesis|uniref:glycosyltransferase family 4 protein n=1 Tax=Thermotoga sp. RQ7 TaxID=126738 RepID=UPI0005A3557E|nr:glycosyltransferase family 4 protein [Thermotoga sp. RQ7]AJG40160.1 hypothetical protein TRQ7_01555 [Thermotoga sp. RQ7]